MDGDELSVIQCVGKASTPSISNLHKDRTNSPPINQKSTAGLNVTPGRNNKIIVQCSDTGRS